MRLAYSITNPMVLECEKLKSQLIQRKKDLLHVYHVLHSLLEFFARQDDFSLFTLSLNSSVKHMLLSLPSIFYHPINKVGE